MFTTSVMAITAMMLDVTIASLLMLARTLGCETVNVVDSQSYGHGKDKIGHAKSESQLECVDPSRGNAIRTSIMFQ